MAKQPVTLMNSVPYGQPVPKRRENESPTRNRATAPAAPPQATSRMAVPRPTARHNSRGGGSAAQQAFRFEGGADGGAAGDALQVRLEGRPPPQVDADEVAPVQHREEVRVGHGETVPQEELPLVEVAGDVVELRRERLAQRGALLLGRAEDRTVRLMQLARDVVQPLLQAVTIQRSPGRREHRVGLAIGEGLDDGGSLGEH